MPAIVFLYLTILMFSCSSSDKDNIFYLEGHRGARGLLPENTIVAMKKAVDLGCNVLEMDVHISRDKQVIVTHDPFANSNFTTLPDGRSLTATEATKYLWYEMDYERIRQLDVGSKYLPNFPKQEKKKVSIPLLANLIDSVEIYTKERGLPAVIYSIEIKSQPGRDGIDHPEPEEFADMVMKVVDSKSLDERFNIQSFDLRPLKALHQKYPRVELSFLTEDSTKSLGQNLRELGFTPRFYSPYYKFVTKEMIDSCNRLGIKCVPWTVNDLRDMQELVRTGVHGLISDYPDLYARLSLH